MESDGYLDSWYLTRTVLNFVVLVTMTNKYSILSGPDLKNPD